VTADDARPDSHPVDATVASVEILPEYLVLKTRTMGLLDGEKV